MRIEYRSAGDSALIMYLHGETPEEATRRIRGLLEALDDDTPPGVTDAIPARSSLLVMYDPLRLDAQTLSGRLSSLSAHSSPDRTEPRLIEIPVLYGGAAGADLPSVAEHAGMHERDAALLHSSVEYTVYFLGFAPGFPYLGPLPEPLRKPRLPTPRTTVPAGSVGVAEDQTGIYPVAGPGGWNLVGRTPSTLFDPRFDPPTLLSPGDRVRFVPIDEATYSRLHFETLGSRA